MVFNYTCTRCGFTSKLTTKFRAHLARKTDCATVEMTSKEFIDRELDFLEKCALEVKELKKELPDIAAFREIVKRYQSMNARAEFVKYEDLDPEEYRSKKKREKDSFIEKCRDMTDELRAIIDEMVSKPPTGVTIDIKDGEAIEDDKF